MKTAPRDLPSQKSNNWYVAEEGISGNLLAMYCLQHVYSKGELEIQKKNHKSNILKRGNKHWRVILEECKDVQKCHFFCLVTAMWLIREVFNACWYERLTHPRHFLVFLRCQCRFSVSCWQWRGFNWFPVCEIPWSWWIFPCSCILIFWGRKVNIWNRGGRKQAGYSQSSRTSIHRVN